MPEFKDIINKTGFSEGQRGKNPRETHNIFSSINFTMYCTPFIFIGLFLGNDTSIIPFENTVERQ